jgi:hypothetical protein
MGGGGSFTPDVDHFRLYDDDAGEAASSPLENEDTNTTQTITGNYAFQLRYMIEEKGGKSGVAEDDWQLQYQKNGAGGYGNLTTTDSGDGIRAAAAGLTNDAATTNRATNGLTDGTNNFDAGEQSSDGLIDDMRLTANDYTDHVYGVEIVYANVSDADYFEFQISSPTGITNNVTPRFTVDKAAPPAATGTGWEMGGGWV